MGASDIFFKRLITILFCGLSHAGIPVNINPPETESQDRQGMKHFLINFLQKNLLLSRFFFFCITIKKSLEYENKNFAFVS